MTVDTAAIDLLPDILDGEISLGRAGNFSGIMDGTLAHTSKAVETAVVPIKMETSSTVV